MTGRDISMYSKLTQVMLVLRNAFSNPLRFRGWLQSLPASQAIGNDALNAYAAHVLMMEHLHGGNGFPLACAYVQTDYSIIVTEDDCTITFKSPKWLAVYQRSSDQFGYGLTAVVALAIMDNLKKSRRTRHMIADTVNAHFSHFKTPKSPNTPIFKALD